MPSTPASDLLFSDTPPAQAPAPLALRDPEVKAVEPKPLPPPPAVRPAVVAMLNHAALSGMDQINGVPSEDMKVLWAQFANHTEDLPPHQRPGLRPYTPAPGNLLSAKAFMHGGGREFQQMLQGTATERAEAINCQLSYDVTQLHLQLVALDSLLNLYASPDKDGKFGMVSDPGGYDRMLNQRGRLQHQLHASLILLRAVQQPGGLRLNLGIAQQINVGNSLSANGSSASAGDLPSAITSTTRI